MSGTTLRNQIRRLRFEHGEMTQDALARGGVADGGHGAGDGYHASIVDNSVYRG